MEGGSRRACLQAVQEVVVEDEALPPHAKHPQDVPPQGLLGDAAIQPQVHLLQNISILSTSSLCPLSCLMLAAKPAVTDVQQHQQQQQPHAGWHMRLQPGAIEMRPQSDYHARHRPCADQPSRSHERLLQQEAEGPQKYNLLYILRHSSTSVEQAVRTAAMLHAPAAGH